MSGVVSVGYFLLSLFFSFAINLLWIRIALCYFRVSALHPLSHFVYQLTSPILHPVEQWLYSKRHRMSRFDGVGFLFIILLECLKFFLISLLLLSAPLSTPSILLFTAADLILQPCNLLFYAILARIILSWINPLPSQPIQQILRMMTDPILGYAQRIIPPIAGFDFSPAIVLIFLEVLTVFIRASMPLNLF